MQPSSAHSFSDRNSDAASRPVRTKLTTGREQAANICFLMPPPKVNRLEEDLFRLVVNRYAKLEWKIVSRQARFRSKSFVHSVANASIEIGKRILDVAGALLLLITVWPLIFLIAIFIKLDSAGPVFFRQKRVGKWGKHFVIYKFRSMSCDAEGRRDELTDQNEMRGGVTFKMRDDPRVTRVGRMLRRTSLDELPQLLNVLRGEMSLVGPRPPVPSEVDAYSLNDRRRLEVKPGITCVWQVSGRSGLTFRQQVELDVAYIESQSLWGDLKLLMKTIPAVLTGRGAY